jgi:hypothetical protein
MMIKGSVAGPIRFTSQGSFASRAQCESDRDKLVHDSQRHSITIRGGWSHYGFHSPNAFAQCVASAFQTSCVECGGRQWSLERQCHCPPPPALDVTGFWEGRSMGICSARSRCGGMVLISLAMIQNESSITGMYRCDASNVACRPLPAPDPAPFCEL